MAKVSTNSIQISDNFIQTYNDVCEIQVLNYSVTNSIIVVHKNVQFEVPVAQTIGRVVVPSMPFTINAFGHEIDQVKLEIIFSKSGEKVVVNSSQFKKC